MIRNKQGENTTSKYAILTFPKRLELSFLNVLAFPNASRMGLVLSTRCSSSPTASSEAAALALVSTTCAVSIAVMRARYDMINFVASVLPAPDSPEMMMAWSLVLEAPLGPV
jgi:hypothetical protein